jgi:LCP family protein required for cell wall assembly
MRTSKKGGRGGSWGAQTAAAAASGAPAVLPAVTYHQSSASTRSVRGHLLRGFGWFLLAVLVIGAGIAGGAYLYANETINALNGNSTPALQRTNGLIKDLGSPNDPAVALIAGYDHRAGDGTNSYAGSNSDTLMLLRADPKNNTLSLLSFPRDLNVPIYCNGNTISTYDRINAAWADCGANGGPKAALDTIAHLSGVPINFLITLDFNAFVQIVHRIHGVYLNVDRRYYIPPNTGTSAINLHPGYQKLDGADALSYVRFRHFDSDVYRNGRQQLFLEALKQRLTQTVTVSNVWLIPKIINAVKGNLAIEKAHGSAVSWGEMKSYLGLLIGLPAGHLLRNSIPNADLVNFQTPGGADELKISDTTPNAIPDAVHSFLHPVVPAEHHAHKGTGAKTPKLPHKSISVLVLNGGNIAGEAADTSYKLHKAGFATKTLPASTQANAPFPTHATVVYYDPSPTNGRAAAEELASLFGSHSRVTEMTPAIVSLANKAGNPLTVVAVGTSYKGKLKVPGASKKHVSTAGAQVEDGASMTLSAVRSKQHAARFRLMVPHKVAAGSAISSEEGVRLFKPLNGKQEFVLTFNLNGGLEYWQIEESNWTDAPLFSKPTATFTSKGRKYEEFTNAGKIQTIAVFKGGSVFWVQNTILNSLSNATMTAIAESLQPHH